MTAIIWTKPDCPNCAVEKDILRAEGYDIEERDADRIDADKDDDAMARLQEQNGALPVVKVNGVFRRPWKLGKEPKPGEW